MHDRLSGSYLDLYDRIIATTAFYTTISNTLWRYQNKLKVINNGVDTSRFNPSVKRDAVREKFHQGQSKVAIYVGAMTTFHTYTAVDILLKAFKKVSEILDAKLLIVGAGDLVDGYKKLAELGISSRITFAGRVKDSELPEYYAASDFAVLPNKDAEGFGLTLLEAMATGKAVIGSKVGGIPGFVRDGFYGLLVEPNNVDQLAKAMSLLGRDDEARAMMGRSCLRFAISNDCSSAASKLVDIYKTLR